MKMLVVGFDGMPRRMFDTIRSFQHYDRRDMYVPLALSGPSWFTMYTGLPASMHRVLDVLGRRAKWAGEMPNTYEDVVDECIWTRLTRLGHTCALCNLPTAVPPIPGAALLHTSGALAYPGAMCEPKTLDLPIRWLEMCDLAQYGTYIGGVNRWYGDWPIVAQGLVQNNASKLFTQIYEDSIAVADWYVQHARDADFGFICFTYIDRLGHIFGLTEAVEGTCSTTTAAVMDVLKYLYADTTLIISDHGFVKPGEVDIEDAAKHHTHNAIIGMRSIHDDLKLLDIELTNRDVVPFILRTFGIDAVAVEALNGNDTDEDLEGIVIERLKGLGYL